MYKPPKNANVFLLTNPSLAGNRRLKPCPLEDFTEMGPVHQPSTGSTQATDQHLPMKKEGHCLTSFSKPSSRRKKEHGV